MRESDAGAMSALPPKADMCSATRHVRFVPIADITFVMRQLGTTSVILLDWRTWYGTVRAERAAIARFRFKLLAASLAVIEELASVGWHPLNRLVPTFRTRDCGGFDHTSAACDPCPADLFARQFPLRCIRFLRCPNVQKLECRLYDHLC